MQFYATLSEQTLKKYLKLENGIPLLYLLALKGMIITIDAMGCQKKIVEKIAEKEAEYVISRRASGCCSHKVIAVGFNTLCYDTTGIKSSARISNRYSGM